MGKGSMFKSSVMFRRLCFLIILEFVLVFIISTLVISNIYYSNYKSMLTNVLENTVDKSHFQCSWYIKLMDLYSGFLTNEDLVKQFASTQDESAKDENNKNLESVLRRYIEISIPFQVVGVYSKGKLVSVNKIDEKYKVQQGNFSVDLPDEKPVLRPTKVDIDKPELPADTLENMSQYVCMYKKIGQDAYVMLGIDTLYVSNLMIQGYVFNTDIISGSKDTSLYIIGSDGTVITDVKFDKFNSSIKDTEYFKTISADKNKDEIPVRLKQTGKYIMAYRPYLEYGMYFMGVVEMDAIAGVVGPVLTRIIIITTILTILLCLLAVFILYRSFAPFDRLVSRVAENEKSYVHGAELLTKAVERNEAADKLAKEKILLDTLQSKPITGRQYEMLQDEYSYEHYLTILGQIDDLEDLHIEISALSVARQITESLLMSLGQVTGITLSEDELLLLVGMDQNYRSSEIKDILLECQRNIKDNFDFTISYIVGTACDNIDDISLAYSQITTSQYVKLCYGSNSVIFAGEGVGNDMVAYPVDIDYEIIDAINNNDNDRILSKIDEFFGLLQNKCSPLISMHINQLVNSIIRNIISLEATQSIFDFQKILLRVFKASCLNSAKKHVLTFAYETGEFIYSSKSVSHDEKHKKVCEGMIKYMEENYSDMNLSMTEVASYFGYSSQYLGRIFKTTTSSTFSKYLNDLRMHEAKQLLMQTNYPINKISEIVGINSSSYFNRLFKKKYGVTPASLRQNDQ